MAKIINGIDDGEGVNGTSDDVVDRTTMLTHSMLILGEMAEALKVANSANAVITGTSGNDTLRGTFGNDTISGLAGSDTIYASQGTDMIDGGAGVSDRLIIMPADATLFASPASVAESITVTADKATNASATLNTSFINIERLTITDLRPGHSAVDVSKFGNSNSTTVITLGDGDHVVKGGAGRDSIIVGLGSSMIDGGDLATIATVKVDTSASRFASVTFDAGVYTVSHGSGASKYTTTVANGTLLLSSGVTGGLFVDASTVQGGIPIASAPFLDPAFTNLFGAWFQDSVYDDVLVGSRIRDEFASAANGRGTINGGNDTLTGNGGADYYDYELALENMRGDHILDFDSDDTLSFAYYNNPSFGYYVSDEPIWLGTSAFTGMTNQVRYEAHDGKTYVYSDLDGDGVADGTLTIENGAFALIQDSTADVANKIKIALTQNFITGGNAAETIAGTTGNDVIRSYDGDDVIVASRGQDFVDGGRGGNRLVANLTDTGLFVAATADTYTLRADRLFSGSGSIDTSFLNIAEVTLTTGGAGGDTIVASAYAGRLTLTAGAGADTITGTAQNDVVNAGAGNDIITGGLGADTLTGGAGADVFRYAGWNDSAAAASDTITDFTAGSDRIDLSALGATRVVVVQQKIADGTGGFTVTSTVRADDGAGHAMQLTAGGVSTAVGFGDVVAGSSLTGGEVFVYGGGGALEGITGYTATGQIQYRNAYYLGALVQQTGYDSAGLRTIEISYTSDGGRQIATFTAGVLATLSGYAADGHMAWRNAYAASGALTQQTGYDANGLVSIDIAYAADGSRVIGDYVAGQLSGQSGYAADGHLAWHNGYAGGALVEQTGYDAQGRIAIDIALAADGSKVVRDYVAGELSGQSGYAADGHLAWHNGYAGGALVQQTGYDAQGRIAIDIALAADGSKVVRDYVAGELSGQSGYAADGHLVWHNAYAGGALVQQTGYDAQGRIAIDIALAGDGSRVVSDYAAGQLTGKGGYAADGHLVWHNAYAGGALIEQAGYNAAGIKTVDIDYETNGTVTAAYFNDAGTLVDRSAHNGATTLYHLALDGSGAGYTMTSGPGGQVLTTGVTGPVSYSFPTADSSTASSYDVITDFHSGSDHIDLSQIAHGAVVVSRSGEWTSIFFDTGGEQGDIAIHGMVTSSDLLVGSGAMVSFVTG